MIEQVKRILGLSRRKTGNKLIISVEKLERRVALLEDGQLEDATPLLAHVGLPRSGSSMYRTDTCGSYAPAGRRASARHKYGARAIRARLTPSSDVRWRI